MPERNPFVIFAKIFFLANVIFSYPLYIIVTNQIIESFIFKKMKNSELRKWLKNLSRTIITILAVLIAVTFYHKLPKILALSGIILGAVIVLILPPLIHNKIVLKD